MKYIRSNNCNVMTKELRKAIINRPKLGNKFLKTRNQESKKCLNRQWNFCVSLLCKTKRCFFGKPDDTVGSDYRIFWKTVGPLFLEKVFHEKLIILNNNKITSGNNEKLVETLNKDFSKLAEISDIEKTFTNNIARSEITNQVFNAIKKYKNFPSIKKSKTLWAVKI